MKPMVDTVPQNNRMYPFVSVSRIKNPSRLYAIPFIGFMIKIIMLIPVVVEVFCLGIAAIVILLINSFIVLFTGKYWKVAYDLNLALLRMSVKINFFIVGITNTYPGFSLTIEDDFSVEIPYNKTPNRFFAIPILGGLARIILLIPYIIYQSLINNASNVAFFVSWIPVLFTGIFPESSFEIMRDNVRLGQATTAYFMGLSDTYPSFWISMHHKKIKIVFIILGIVLSVSRGTPYHSPSHIKQQRIIPPVTNSY